jgi:AraC-like DNA-binding protein
MIENIINITTAILGFIVVFLIGFGYKTNRNTNFYLMLIFTLSSVRFLLHSTTFSVLSSSNLIQYDFIFYSSAAPLTYLYFINLARNNSTFKRNDLIHYISPIILFILKYYANSNNYFVGQKIGFVFLIIFNIAYTLASYMYLRKKVWNRESTILLINQQNNNIKNWTKLLFSFYILILIRFLINLSFIDSIYWHLNKNDLLWIGGIIWIIMYIKIIYSPEFLYGYEVFQNKIKEYKKHTIIFDNIWIMNNTKEVTNIQDSILKIKIENNLENYIHEIENQALNSTLFFSETFSLIDIANKLNIPKSHLLYLFKYHSAISFSDFKKIIRIQKSIELLNNGYLKNSTFDSLANETGFSSYSSFYKSFKNNIGKSPQEYFLNSISK